MHVSNHVYTNKSIHTFIHNIHVLLNPVYCKAFGGTVGPLFSPAFAGSFSHFSCKEIPDLYKINHFGLILFNIFLWKFSENCLYNHHYKMTTCLVDQCWVWPSQFPYNLYCLRWPPPAATFLPPNEKNLSKTATAKLYPAKKWKKCVKISFQLFLFYCYLIMQSLMFQAFQWIFFTWAINRPCKEVFPKMALAIYYLSKGF